MKLTHIFTVAACCLSVACNRQTAEKPAPEDSPKSSTEVTVKLPSLDAAVDKLKADVKDVAEAAKEKLAENAEVEIERIAKQLDEVAGDFNTNAGQLEGDAKEQFEKMRVEFDRKKEVFRQKLKEFKEGSEEISKFKKLFAEAFPKEFKKIRFPETSGIGFKPISFWQAWGLILLSQILFKANMHSTARTGRWRHRDPAHPESATTPSDSPLGGSSS